MISTYLIQKLFIPIVQYACVVKIVTIVGIFSLIELKHGFSTSAAPGGHPILRDRATAPSSTHTAALAISGERTGVAAKLSDNPRNTACNQAIHKMQTQNKPNSKHAYLTYITGIKYLVPGIK